MTTEIKAPQPEAAWTLTSETDGWMASHDGMGSSEYRAVKDASGTVVALVVAQSDDNWADLDTETPGRLIAALPELLEALRVAHDHLDMQALEVSHCRDAALIRGAIAKLKGA